MGDHFFTFMRIQNLHETIARTTGAVDGAKNAETYAELVQFLDDRSLSLVMRDAKDDGRAALKILRGHYLSKSKPKVIALYTELTSLVKVSDETVTDYVIRAQTAATNLKTAEENISDSLLVAMVIKGLPSKYKSFLHSNYSTREIIIIQ